METKTINEKAFTFYLEHQSDIDNLYRHGFFNESDAIFEIFKKDGYIEDIKVTKTLYRRRKSDII